MDKATIVVKDAIFLNNKFFSKDPTIIRDDQHSCFIELKKTLLKSKVDLSTEDINPVAKSKICIYLNVEKHALDTTKKIIYGLMQEPPGVNDDNWDLTNYAQYTRLFTWNDDYVDDKKVFKLPFGYALHVPEIDRAWSKRLFCTSIIGFKNSDHPLDLYGERTNISKWFSKHHASEYTFYGKGWSNVFSLSKIVTNITKNPYKLGKIISKYYSLKKVYGGEVSSKKSSLSKYKFSICFENRKNLPGFLTEKIFDCFAAGTIPVYWGASNINDLIPSNCYIDYRKFATYDDLYKHLKSIDQKKYEKYMHNIQLFITGEKSIPFRDKTYAVTLKKYILHDLKMLYKRKRPNDL